MQCQMKQRRLLGHNQSLQMNINSTSVEYFYFEAARVVVNLIEESWS